MTQTQLTRTGQRDMKDKRPKRRKVKVSVQKDLDGAYRINNRLDRGENNG